MTARPQYLEKLRSLSDQLIKLQSPIRILDSIKWPAEWRQQFFASDARRLPPANKSYYRSIPLSFDTEDTRQGLKALKKTICNQLGKEDPLGKILVKTCRQYLTVVNMLEQRGKAAFGDLSQELYGSATDHMYGTEDDLLLVGEKLCKIFSQPAVEHLDFRQPKIFGAEKAVSTLQERLNRFFPHGELRVTLSDGIVSDAAAGGDTIKMNSRAFFSERDLKVLEVHEGWVHVGTTLNGRTQPHATWLSVGSPRIAAMQEGLVSFNKSNSN